MEIILTTSGISIVIFSFLAWMGRNFIAQFFKNAIKYDYDEKIEKLKAEIKSNESDILALRSGALSGVVERQKVLFSKQVLAVEKLWANVILLMPAKNASMLMQAVDYDEWAKKSERDGDVRKTFEMMGNSTFQFEKIKKLNALDIRPFVSEILWAYYWSYQSILIHDLTKIQLIKIGTYVEKIDDTKHLERLLVAALPEYKETIENNKTTSYYHFLELLENKILDEIKKILDGGESDKDNIEKAKTILDIANILNKEQQLGQKSE